MNINTNQMVKITAEHTDTFGGEANYAWVRRVSFKIHSEASRRSIVSKAKKALGLTGIHFITYDHGDMIQLDVVGACERVFITFSESESE